MVPASWSRGARVSGRTAETPQPARTNVQQKNGFETTEQKCQSKARRFQLTDKTEKKRCRSFHCISSSPEIYFTYLHSVIQEDTPIPRKQRNCHAERHAKQNKRKTVIIHSIIIVIIIINNNSNNIIIINNNIVRPRMEPLTASDLLFWSIFS